eukprot:2746540-Pleurochrysis_carterae.AAC.2
MRAAARCKVIAHAAVRTEHPLPQPAARPLLLRLPQRMNARPLRSRSLLSLPLRLSPQDSSELVARSLAANRLQSCW